MFSFLESLEVALYNGGTSEAVRGWLSIADYLQKLAKQDKKWRHRALEIRNLFLLNAESETWKCECAFVEEKHHREHFVRNHLHWLKED